MYRLNFSVIYLPFNRKLSKKTEKGQKLSDFVVELGDHTDFQYSRLGLKQLYSLIDMFMCNIIILCNLTNEILWLIDIMYKVIML